MTAIVSSVLKGGLGPFRPVFVLQLIASSASWNAYPDSARGVVHRQY